MFVCQEEAQEWMKKSEKSFERNNFLRAEEKYSEALQLANDRVIQTKLYMGRGVARYLQGRIDEGKSDISLSKSLCSDEGKVRILGPLSLSLSHTHTHARTHARTQKTVATREKPS